MTGNLVRFGKGGRGSMGRGGTVSAIINAGTHAQGNYCACPTEKGAYQPRNTKIDSSRRMAFSRGGKGITLICVM